jgi:cytochrome c oxidase assembly protein subunit 15
MTQTELNTQKWTRILFYFWIYTLLVILWGAWVRISHSGNGCGDHWPLCEGAFIPTTTDHKTWVEYAHRLMSGSYGLIVFFIYSKIRKFNLSPRLNFLNRALLLLMITEALIGALLVKGQLTTENDSFTRLVVMSFHQLNSFVLTGVTYLIYLHFKLKYFIQSPTQINHKYLILFLLLPLTGAIASLSTTLFPTISLWQGLIDDFSKQNHLFIRLRILHPVFAILIASGLSYYFFLKSKNRLALEFLLAMAVGVVTLLTLSPIYLKIAHLLIAHVLWARLIQFVSFPDSSKR